MTVLLRLGVGKHEQNIKGIPMPEAPVTAVSAEG